MFVELQTNGRNGAGSSAVFGETMSKFLLYDIHKLVSADATLGAGSQGADCGSNENVTRSIVHHCLTIAGRTDAAAAAAAAQWRVEPTKRKAAPKAVGGAKRPKN